MIYGIRIMFLPPSAVGDMNVIRVATQLLRSVFQVGYVLEYDRAVEFLRVVYRITEVRRDGIISAEDRYVDASVIIHDDSG